MTLNVANVSVGTWGATPGKLDYKLRILTAQGDKLAYVHGLPRALSKLISLFTCLIGFIIAAFDSDKPGFHDGIYGTRGLRQEA
jgi:uncharacterized RDD family membrane protein YckC